MLSILLKSTIMELLHITWCKSKRPFFHCFSNVSRVLYVTWHHFTLSSSFPPLEAIFQAFYSNLPLLSHSFPIVLRHIPSFVHCLSQISDIWHEDCIAYIFFGKNSTSAHHMCVISSWIPQQTRRMK